MRDEWVRDIGKVQFCCTTWSPIWTSFSTKKRASLDHFCLPKKVWTSFGGSGLWLPKTVSELNLESVSLWINATPVMNS